MISVHLESEEFKASLGRIIQAAKRPKPILQAAARVIRRLLQRHFREREKTPNALGGRRTHWWAAASRATQIASVTDTEAVVSISQPGMALKVYGGVVRPVQAKALTIPIHAEAYGRRARTVELLTGMKLFKVKPKGSKNTFLARSTGDDQIRLLYLLASSAKVRPDPNALPNRSQMEREALAAAEAQLLRAMDRSAPQPLA